MKENTVSILLVEDDPFIGTLLSKRLVSENFHINRVIDTTQAKKILEAEPVNLILLDIMLPGTNGLTFLSQIKSDEKLKKIPVIIISNFDKKEYIDEGTRAGAIDYIIKANSTPDEIIGKIKATLQKNA